MTLLLLQLSSEGLLSFVDTPDYEAPADGDADNIYVVTVSVSDGKASDQETIGVTILDALEGRVVDGPIANAEVVLSAGDGPDQGNSETDEAGNWLITSELIPAARITSAGGTDTSTGNELPNLILISDVPEAGVESINVNAITTVLSVVETAEEKQALLTKLGIEGTPDDLIAKDIWAGSESGDQVSQRAQRINAQLNVVLTTASSIITGVDEDASPLAIVEAAASSVVTATADVEEVSLQMPVYWRRC